MAKNKNVRFIRRHGKVVPIRVKPGDKGRVKPRRPKERKFKKVAKKALSPEAKGWIIGGTSSGLALGAGAGAAAMLFGKAGEDAVAAGRRYSAKRTSRQARRAKHISQVRDAMKAQARRNAAFRRMGGAAHKTGKAGKYLYKGSKFLRKLFFKA